MPFIFAGSFIFGKVNLVIPTLGLMILILGYRERNNQADTSLFESRTNRRRSL